VNLICNNFYLNIIYGIVCFYVLIVFLLHRESLKLFLVDEPPPRVVLSQRRVRSWEACKHGFVVPFYCTCKGPPLSLLGCNIVGVIKLAAALVHTYVLSHELLSPPHLVPYA
jgi:hypothetical protein